MFIFQFLNDKIYNYVLFDKIVKLIIQKLKNKHTFLKKVFKLSKAKFSRQENFLTEKEEIFRNIEINQITTPTFLQLYRTTLEIKFPIDK